MVKDFTYTNVGSHTIASVDMLDKDTCVLTFFEEKVGDNFVVSQVEYWLDDDEWVFETLEYDIDADFVGNSDKDYLTEEEKQICKDIIKEYLSDLK